MFTISAIPSLPPHRTPGRRRVRQPQDFDERGRYLYVGDVEDAMPEGNWPRWLANYLLETILRFVVILERDSAYANLPIYYERGTRKHVSPDVFFLPGIPYEVRRASYCLWEGGLPPRVVFEILSKGSELKDRVANRRLYEALGVSEYYWFEPETNALEALELDPATRTYRPRTADAEGRYFSAGLSLHVGMERDRLGLFRGGTYLPPSQELLTEAQDLRAEAEEARADAEAARADSEAARAAAEQARAAAEQARAEIERALATERARTAELERRVSELEARQRGGTETSAP